MKGSEVQTFLEGLMVDLRKCFHHCGCDAVGLAVECDVSERVDPLDLLHSRYTEHEAHVQTLVYPRSQILQWL